ncbi:MAG: N-acetylmuramic acid 6-phosphate etherase [Candidatus Marinimicrobia bacterium]|nr:N-acetylmuramic acid 6-phosphate etherase [Candidatus Neomarinimicrobiota bacterium]
MKINKITEQINSRTKNIDQLPIEDILKSINDEDKLIGKQVEKAIPNISAFVDHAVSQIKKTGRLIYIGSGTSGRLGVLDASECPPTFGVSSDLVLGIISGGDRALRESIENAEDSYRNSIHDLNKISLNNNDILLGISASGTTPYVLSALSYAKQVGALTGFLTCNDIKSLNYVDFLIKVLVGPEILTGSTRLKSGTATKMVLNMISTTTMMKLNRTYGNLMIDLKPNNKKLVKRALNILSEELNITITEAKEIYASAGNNLKIAILMGKKGLTFDEANKLISDNNGSLANSLNEK